MKITDVIGKAESNGEIEEQFFSIEDKGMIFDILRNKMYSNPMLAICREITCNARDAHREVGKSDIPIQIHLPNLSDPFYKIKDFGPGISPERMSNIFIKYTASTKRDDNSQTGGFGLGAKTPFAYSNTFNINTIYNGIQYNYICFIDETKVGKLSLLSQNDTNEGNGTEIIIPIKNNDFNFFSVNTEFCTRHWDVKPIIKGGTINYDSIKKENIIFNGGDWLNCLSTHSYSRNIKLIIDKIEYPLDIDQFRSFKIDQPDKISIFNQLKGDLYLYFSVGEISISASREQIYIDKSTKIKINEKLEKVFQDISSIVKENIESCKDYYSANIAYGSISKKFYDNTIIKDIKWNGMKLYSDCIDIKCSISCFEKGAYSKKWGSNPNKITKSSARYLKFIDNAQIVINDLKIENLTARHVKKIFEENYKLSTIFVITPDDKVTQESLNESINLNLMRPKLLSSYISYTQKKNYSNSRLYVYKYMVSDSSFSRVSLSNAIDDSGKKVLCQLTSNKSACIKNIKNQKYYFDLSLLRTFGDYSFYGVDESISSEKLEEVFDSFEDLDDVVYEALSTTDRDYFIKMKYLITLDNVSSIDSALDRIKTKVKNKHSIFVKKIEQQLKISSERKEAFAKSKLLETYEFLNSKITSEEITKFQEDNEIYDLNNISEKYNKMYPLLKFISSYSIANDDAIKSVADYIDMVDANN